MTTLLIRLMNAKTLKQVDAIIEGNIYTLRNPFNEAFLVHAGRQAQRRINGIQREKEKSFKIFEKN